MKIIHCPRRFTEHAWGGTETCLINLARQQQAAGHEVVIHTTKALDDEPFSVIEGIPVHRHDYFYPWFNLSHEEKKAMDQSGGNLFSFGLLKALLEEPGVDLIHAHTGKRMGGIVRTAAKIKGIPYVTSLHGGVVDVPAEISHSREQVSARGIEWGKLLGAAVGARRVFDDASAIFCLSRTEQQAATSSYQTQVEYLPNGVNAQRFASGNGAVFRARFNIPAGVPLLLVMGRIDPQKNQRFLVSLMPQLRETLAGAHLLLIGHITDEQYHRDLLADIDRLNMNDSVTVIPGLPNGSDDLVNAYHAADLFCLPSIHEPFGLVILEAWSAGLPVVAANVGGIPDFTRDGVDALLAQPGNAGLWIQQIIDALSAPRRDSLARCGRNRAETEFDWAIIGDMTLDVYRSLAA